MTERIEMLTNEYVSADCCIAAVNGHNSRGSYPEPDNGQNAERR